MGDEVSLLLRERVVSPFRCVLMSRRAVFLVFSGGERPLTISDWSLIDGIMQDDARKAVTRPQQKNDLQLSWLARASATKLTSGLKHTCTALTCMLSPFCTSLLWLRHFLFSAQVRCCRWPGGESFATRVHRFFQLVLLALGRRNRKPKSCWT